MSEKANRKRMTLREIVAQDWRPWAYACLVMRAPSAWEIVVRPLDIASVVPSQISDSYSWKMHQQFAVSALKNDGRVWVAKPIMLGDRHGVSLKAHPSIWEEEHGVPISAWSLPDLLEALKYSGIDVPDSEAWTDLAATHWEVAAEDAKAIGILIELLVRIFDDDQEEPETGLRLVN